MGRMRSIIRSSVVALACLAAVAASVDAAPGDRTSRRRDRRASKKKVTPPPVTVVAIMESTGQALLWDNKRREYVVVKLGDRFRRFRVTLIGQNQVVLTSRRTKESFVLPRVADVVVFDGSHEIPTAPASGPALGPETGSTTSTGLSAGDVLDPYTPSSPPPAPPAVPRPEVVLDPYGASDRLNRTSGQGAKRSGAGRSPDYPIERAGELSTDHVLDPYATPSSPLPPTSRRPPPLYDESGPLQPESSAPVPQPVPQPAPQVDPTPTRTKRYKVSRRKFDAATSDFHALGQVVRVSMSEEGVRIDELVRRSFFYRIGLRAGDVILNVDGRKVRDVNDAAEVYAHLLTAKRFVVDVRRGSDIVRLRYRFVR